MRIENECQELQEQAYTQIDIEKASNPHQPHARAFTTPLQTSLPHPNLPLHSVPS